MRIEPQINSGRSEPRINDNNLVLWLNDNGKTASNWYDQSGKNNHGTVYGAGTPPPATPQALGYLFDGVDDYVNAGNNASLNSFTSEISVFAWFRGTVGQSIVRKQDISNYIILGWSPTLNDVHLLSWDGETVGLATGGISDNIWHYIGMTWKRNTINGFKTWKEGVIVAQRNSADIAIPTIASDLLLGRHVAGEEFTNGSIDEVRIFNRALSAGEITKLFNQYRGKFGI